MTSIEHPRDAKIEMLDDPLERALRRHNESLVISQIPEGVQPQGLDLASVEAILQFVRLLVELPAAGVGLYLGVDKIVQVRRKRQDDEATIAPLPDLDEISDRLRAGEITPEEARAQLPRWLLPGSPAHRQVLELAIDGGQLLEQLRERGLPGRIAKQIVNETRRAL